MFRKLLSNLKRKPLWLALVLLLLVNVGSEAQSLDVGAPTPIRTQSVTGHIPVRDVGDSRLTDHYYAFTGVPGDLLITVKSQNLNGDLDVFTAGTLRPLLKLTLYAESSSAVTKGIYLRKREDLILRIEARSPNDDEGTYQLFFGGSFEPIAGGSGIAENDTATTEPLTSASNGKTRRVSSVGARLPEPEPPVTEAAEAPTSLPAAIPTATPTESPLGAPPEKIEEAPKTAATTSPRTRRPAGRRTVSPVPVKPKPVETPAVEETAKTEESGEATEPAKPKIGTRTSTRRGSTTASRTSKPEPVTAAPAPAEPEIGPRLIIETSDGTLINRSMSTIRRVIVENGQVVVTGKDGKIDRIQLAAVVRMSIAQ
jgi:pyruvate/2-oxoglutarate dehydrogenase complex dihydrolipoamide acyltransferase (E2) component